MFQTLVLQIVAGIGGLALATRFLDGVVFTGETQILLIAGAVLGVVNTFIRPIINLFTLPIRILTLGLSSLVVNVLIVWAIDIYFVELDIQGLRALFLTTVIIWGVTLVVNLFSKGVYPKID